jgi:hypothetical protein
MSLMNDALRKKSHETTGSPAAVSFIDVHLSSLGYPGTGLLGWQQ